MSDLNTRLRDLPSIDELLRSPEGDDLCSLYGSDLVTGHLRRALEEDRKARLKKTSNEAPFRIHEFLSSVRQSLEIFFTTDLRSVFNLTGTVLHTNLGRSPLPSEAIEEIARVSSGASNIEYDLGSGKRGDRDKLVERWVSHLTGAEAATVVNNNAAAVLLVLNTLARRKEVPVSRGELVEIGGSFRIPEVMSRAGSKLVEVGTTNRTHLDDFSHVLSNKTGLVMKVHTSNYVVEGFTSEVPDEQLSELCRAHNVPFVNDLGSGTLLDLSSYGLPKEETVAESLARGADLVTFSGDKLLGGPQCGIIAGKADLIARIKKNALKRALRVDKLTMAALGAVLKLYTDPVRVIQKVPALRLLTRSRADILAVARRISEQLQTVLGPDYSVEVTEMKSQIGSGAMPIDLLPSAGLRIGPKKKNSRMLRKIISSFRQLPKPVVGRVNDDALVLDLRCLELETEFLQQLSLLKIARES